MYGKRCRYTPTSINVYSYLRYCLPRLMLTESASTHYLYLTIKGLGEDVNRFNAGYL